MRAARRHLAAAVVCAAIAGTWVARRMRGRPDVDGIAGRLAGFAVEHREHSAKGVGYLERYPYVGFYCHGCCRGEVYDISRRRYGTVRMAEEPEPEPEPEPAGP